MERDPNATAKNGNDREDAFISLLDANPLPVGEALRLIGAAAPGGGRERAWCELLVETLAGRRDAPGTLEVLEWMAARREDAESLAAMFADAVERSFADARHKVFAESAAIRETTAVEGLRRLRLLETLAPGVFVQDGTWGFGVVRHVDEFYRRVSIDFRRKPGHSMSLSYAAASLRIAGPDHIHARLREKPDEVRSLVGNDPAELVRMALRSYGPMDVERIQALLTEEIVQPAGWKAFWESARKALKADPMVDFPARRSEPLRLLESKKSRDASWFASLAAENDPEKILEAISELAASCEPVGAERRGAIGNRLSYVAWASEKTHPERAALAAMSADEWRLTESEGWNDARVLAALWEGGAFLKAVSNLTARETRRFLKWISAKDPGKCRSLTLTSLNDAPLAAVGEILGFLAGSGAETEALDAVSGLLAARSASVGLLAWCCRNTETVFDRRLATPSELLLQVIEALERPESGERLRSQNQLRRLLQDREWLKAVCDSMEPSERALALVRVKTCGGLDQTTSRAVMGSLVVLYPDLASELSGRPEEAVPPEGRARFTSWRTYRERQEQLRDIVESQIPANSRDIATARSYGDLRENSEYKYAREHQRFLYRRIEELRRDLKEVRGTDFSNVPTDRCGMGTRAVIRRPDGREQVVQILGEWDRDESLGIISCRSRMAECLAGKAPGDTAALPSDSGEEPCAVVRVGPVSEDVRTWISGVGGDVGGD